MLKLLRELLERMWAVIGGFLSLIARLLGHHPPVPQMPHENITPADIALELDQARRKEAEADMEQPGLEATAEAILSYANAAGKDRCESDLGILPEEQRTRLLLMKDIDLARLATNRVLCMQWHILGGKFPTVSETAPEVRAQSKADVVSNAFMTRMRACRSLPLDDEIPPPSYGIQM